MSCVLDILSLHELRIRKEHLLKQIKIVEERILKKEQEENTENTIENTIEKLEKIIENNDYTDNEPKKIVVKKIINIIKKNVEQNLNNTNIQNKNVKVTIKTLKIKSK